jgi:cell division protein FtsB
VSVLDRPVLIPSGEAARSFRRALALTSTLALVVLAILLPVMQSSDETAQGYRIRSLERQKTDLDAQIHRSQSQIAQLGSLARIDSDARNRLGMVPITREVALDISVPLPRVHSLPNGYLPAGTDDRVSPGPSLWTRLRRLLPHP